MSHFFTNGILFEMQRSVFTRKWTVSLNGVILNDSLPTRESAIAFCRNYR